MPAEDRYVTGNTSGNLMNGGLIVRRGGEYYFTCFEAGECMVRADLSMGSRRVMYPGACRNFNLYQDKIIFCDLGDGQKIKALDLKTEAVETLVDSNTFLLTVSGQYLFYRNNSCGERLFRYDLVLKENRQLTDCRSWYITPVRGEVYFRNYDILKLACVSFGGSGYRVLSEDTPVDIIHDGEYLYYGNWDKGKRLTKLRIGEDASHEVPLCADAAFSVNERGDWLYYSNWNDGKGMYAIRKDGTGRRKLLSEPVWCINIIDDFIFYRIHGDDTSLYRMKIGGSRGEKI